MNSVVQVRSLKETDSLVVVASDIMNLLGKKEGQTITLRFGTRIYPAILKLSNELNCRQIFLSEDIIQELYLPTYPVFEIKAEEDEMIFGPFIGLLVGKHQKAITRKLLRRVRWHMREYPRLHGAIIVFALSGIRIKEGLIEGYCYDPITKQWRKNLFPHPPVVYRARMVGLSEKWRAHFQNVIGNRLFNSPYFDKWQMHQFLSVFSASKPHLPHTILYRSPQDIFSLLAQYPKVYIKPILGLKGKGVTLVGWEGGTVIFETREKAYNKKVVLKEAEAKKFIKSSFSPGKYIIQEAIPLLEDERRRIDFRCIAQKDEAGEWICRGIIGRCGSEDSVVSNLANGGKARQVDDILMKSLKLSEDQAGALKEDMVSFVLKICRIFDENGIHFGDLGIDLGIDQQGHIWLIEVNHRNPDPYAAMRIPDKKLYYTAKTGPLLYAKFLAGFGSRGDDHVV